MSFISLKNIVHLLKKQLLEQRRFYLLSLLGIFVTVVIFNMAFYYFTDEMNRGKYTFFTIMVSNFGFIIASSLVAAASFYELHNPKSSITYLQLPVTFPERILSNIIIAFVLIPILMLAVFYGTDWLFTTIYNTRNLPRFQNPKLVPGLYFSTMFNLADYTLLTLLLTSIYFAGSVFFKKLNWVLTTVSAGLFITLIVCMNVLPAINGHVVLPFILSLSHKVIENGLTGWDKQFDRSGYVLLTGFRYFLWCTPLLLTLAVYYRLKEKEV
jgi:MFS family permease